MCSDDYIKTPQALITSATSCVVGRYVHDTANTSFKFSIRFSGSGGLRQYDDGVGGTATGVVRTGFTTNASATSGSIVIFCREAFNQTSLHWYSVSGLTATYVSSMTCNMRAVSPVVNETTCFWHPCFTQNTGSMIVTALSERFLANMTFVGGTFNPNNYYNPAC